jgi:hypothetical protein
MDCRIYSPDITTTTVVNSYNNAAGLTYVANTAMAYWGGRFWAVMDGMTNGFYEGGGTQRIWMVTSVDGVTWSAPFQPFRNATYCTNPFAGSGTDWQPGLVAVGGELWCVWSNTDAYISKLTSPTGKWTNYRFEFGDDNQPFISSTITGSAAEGRSVEATIDGITDFYPFPAGDPVVLSGGRVACPVTLQSRATQTTQVSGSSVTNFVKTVKRNAILFTTNGTDWSMTLVPSLGDYTAWEPFIVESPAGHLSVFSRNLDPYGPARDNLLVSTSFDGGATFSPSASTELDILNARGSAKRVSPTRWFMTHGDYSNPDSNLRWNATLYPSRRGSDDFVPGIQVAEFAEYAKYPQLITVDTDLYVNLTTGRASNSVIGYGRQSMKMVRVSPLPDDDYAYIHPNSRSIYRAYAAGERSDPELVAGSPDYYRFNGFTDAVTSTSTITTAGGLTFMAWIRHDHDPPYDATLIDNRTGTVQAGGIFRVNGGNLGSLQMFHFHDMPIDVPMFVALSIDNTAMTATYYTCYGQTDFVTTVSYFKSILFTGQPSNNDTITVDGTVFTFKTTASATNDVQIGAAASDTANNLRLKINTLMGTNNNAATYVLATRLLISRTNGASFTVTSGAANITVESSIDLSGGVAHFGAKRPGSGLRNYHGHIYDARIYGAALTAANMRYLFNERRTEFGYSEISGTSTAPSSPLLSLDPANPDNVEFPSVGQVARCEIVSDSLLRIHGESSAALELPYGASEVVIRYKLGAVPSGGDKYVIATFGTVDKPIRLYIDSANPTALYANGYEVQSGITSTNWNTVTVIVSTRKVTIGSVFERHCSGKPRCFLGSVYPESLLAATKTIDYDISAMSVEKAVTAA